MRGARLPVGELRRDGEDVVLALLHGLDALVPSLDHLALAELELERGYAVAAGIELRPVEESARVMHCIGNPVIVSASPHGPSASPGTYGARLAFHAIDRTKTAERRELTSLGLVDL